MKTTSPEISREKLQYLTLLAEKYPSIQQVCTEIINLQAILNLPKGTEHFISDVHGEYEAFCHILNNCSGVVREKVSLIYDGKLSKAEQAELCTLIYYPEEKMELCRQNGSLDDTFYETALLRLIELCRSVASKYTRSKVRK
ncbi:MAG: fructose-bisphosphatase class III, partial [Oscillospiraceae bacterium]